MENVKINDRILVDMIPILKVSEKMEYIILE